MNAAKVVRFILVATVLTLVACSLVAARNRAARESALQRMYDVGHNPRIVADVGRVRDAFGRDGAKAALAKLSPAYPEFAFDGDHRFCQIHREGYRGKAGYSDAIVLSSLDGGGSAIWCGPFGLRIGDVEFEGVGLKVFVHGDFSVDSTRFEVPESSPLPLSIPWRSGEQPTPGRFERLIARAQD